MHAFLLYVSILLLWYLPLTQPESHPKRVTFMLVKPLRTSQGTLGKRWARRTAKAVVRDGVLEEVIERR